MIIMKTFYLPLTDEQREKLSRETGTVCRFLVKRPGEGWAVTGSLPFDAILIE